MSRAFLIVDIQNDFLPKGALGVAGGNAVIDPVNRILASVHFDLVIYTQDWHPEGHISFASSHPSGLVGTSVETSYGTQILWPEHCVQNTHGAALSEKLRYPQTYEIWRKGTRPQIDSYSAFIEADRQTETGLAKRLKDAGITEIFIAGLATDFCVLWSALDAVKKGFKVTVIEDACAGIDIDGSLQKAIEAMQKAGVEFTNLQALIPDHTI